MLPRQVIPHALLRVANGGGRGVCSVNLLFSETYSARLSWQSRVRSFPRNRAFLMRSWFLREAQTKSQRYCGWGRMRRDWRRRGYTGEGVGVVLMERFLRWRREEESGEGVSVGEGRMLGRHCLFIIKIFSFQPCLASFIFIPSSPLPIIFLTSHLLPLVDMCGYNNKIQPMKERLRATANRIQHITHMLNTSTSKLVHPFRWAQRFPPNKSLSPDVYYDLPSSLGKRSCSFGIGMRRSLQKIDHTEPARYKIPSQFDIKKQQGGKGAFGISREEYYKGKTQKIPLGPGQYTIKDPIGSKRFYMGQKISPAQRNQTGNRSFKKEEGYSSQSHRNKDTSLRMKTDHALKQPFNSGSYTQRSALTQNSGSYSQQRKKVNSFGDTARGKVPKASQPGPGSYKIFSEFGNNL